MTETNYEAAQRILKEASSRELREPQRAPLLQLASVYANLALADAYRGDYDLEPERSELVLPAPTDPPENVAGEWGVYPDPEHPGPIQIRLMSNGALSVFDVTTSAWVSLFVGFASAQVEYLTPEQVGQQVLADALADGHTEEDLRALKAAGMPVTPDSLPDADKMRESEVLAILADTSEDFDIEADGDDSDADFDDEPEAVEDPDEDFDDADDELAAQIVAPKPKRGGKK